MCLSTVYKIVDNKKVLLWENIMTVSFEEDKIVCLDLLGRKREVEGKIEKIDLMENEILVK